MPCFRFEFIYILVAWKIDNCILSWASDKRDRKFPQVTKKGLKFSWTSFLSLGENLKPSRRYGNVERYKKTSYKHFPEGNFSYIPHPLSLYTTFPSPRWDLFSHKKSSFLLPHSSTIFTCKKGNKKFLVLEASEMREKNSTKEINFDKNKKNENWFCPDR